MLPCEYSEISNNTCFKESLQTTASDIRLSSNEASAMPFILQYMHCVQSVQIRSFLWSVFSRIRTEYSAGMRENTDQKKLRIWTLFTR